MAVCVVAGATAVSDVVGAAGVVVEAFTAAEGAAAGAPKVNAIVLL